MKLAFAALLSAALAVPQLASAQYEQPGNGYVQFRLGAYMPSHDDVKDFDPGVDVEVVLGKMLTPNLGLEGGIGYFRGTYSYSEFDYTWDEVLGFMPLTASLRAMVNAGPLSLSGLAGLGLYFFKYEWEEVDAGWVSTFDDVATFLGLHLGGTAAVRISPQASIGVDLRYVIGKPKIEGYSFNMDGLRASLALNWDF